LQLPVVLRIGIEHLPPDLALAETSEPRVESQPLLPIAPPPVRTEERVRTDSLAGRHPWSLSAADLASIEDPIARESLLFVDDLLEADRRRVREEVGTPFFDAYDAEQALGGPLLNSEELLLAAQQEWLQDRGPSLMRRPLRKLLRRLPIVQQVEVDFEDFRGEHVPLTEPYHQVHGDRTSMGRMSLRIRTSDFSDPVEVAWVHKLVRVGTSQEYAKLTINLDLLDDVRLELRGRTEYRSGGRDTWRADLSYRPTATTSFHVSVGDDMDFLSTSSLYSLFESPIDGSTGVVLYAVHVF
jgi:hypothetical protein